MSRIALLLIFVFSSVVFFSTEASLKKKILSEEIPVNGVSSVFLYTQDSIINNQYNSVLRLVKEKDYVKALRKSLALYDKLRKEDDKVALLNTTFLIADVYIKTNNNDKALNFFKKALQIIKKSELDKKAEIVNVNDRAKAYLRLGGTFQKLNLNDSAKFYYKKIENHPSLNEQILSYKAVSFANLAGLYQKDSLYNKAKEYARKAIAIHQQRNDKLNEVKAINNLANIHLVLGEFEIAKEHYLKAINLIKNDNSQNAVRRKADLYYNLAWAMRNLKEYEAYDYLEGSYEIEDAMRDKEFRRMIEEVTAKYDVEGVKREEENKRLQQRTTFWIYAISSLIAILSLLYWVNFYKLRQKNLRLKLSQTELLQNQNLEKLRSESQTRILNATIDGKETERKEIAETLHDSVSALLSSANLHLMATKKQFNGKTPIEIDKTQEIIVEASKKIRDLSHTLVSSVLLKFGLTFAIKDLAGKYSNSELQIETDIEGLSRYHQNFEIKVYNIIQEFINNILKHSKAKKATIKIREKNKNICFKISDNGIGFDKTKISDKDGLGINQIDARIQIMKGKFHIESIFNKGTVIEVEIPIKEKETTIYV